MAVLRFTRDKRGYEHFYLVQPPHRRDKTPARVLYWFRTPPNVRVGREPFDEAIRRELERQNPGVAFDWRRITETPIPSADAEKWRERRREERAAKLARRAAAAQPAAEPPVGDEEVAAEQDAMADEMPADAPVHVLEKAVEAQGSSPDAPGMGELVTHPVEDAAGEGTGPSQGTSTDLPAAAETAQSPHRHRRRRRRRRGRRGPPEGPRGPSGAAGGDV